MEEINSKNLKTVAIIGAGPSGLFSCKSCLETGVLIPTVYEKNKDIGGVWSKSNGKVWDSLHTNISVNLMVVSDFPWKEEWYSKEFPPHAEFTQYLQRYTDHFQLNNHIKFNTNVLSVYPLDENESKWVVKSEIMDHNSNSISIRKNISIELYDYVIVASGMFEKSRPISSIKDLDKFTGEISHSRYYKNPKSFKDKRVLVIGDISSGCDIAADLAASDYNVKVTHLVKNPPWCISGFVPNTYLSHCKQGILEGDKEDQYESKQSAQNLNNLAPLDEVFYSRKVTDFYKYSQESKRVDGKLLNIKKNEWFTTFCQKQQSLKDISVDVPNDGPPFRCKTETYVELVSSGKIKVQKLHQLTGISGNNVYFSTQSTNNGELIEGFDHILLANGYSNVLPFFDDRVLADLEYDPNHRLVPVLLYKTVFHPTLSKIGFVGWYKGAFIHITELQSRWIAQVFSGNLERPSNDEIKKGIEEERSIRNDPQRIQFPHSDVVKLADEIANQFGVLPDLNEIKVKDPHLYKTIYNSASPAIYRLYGPHSNHELALKTLYK